MQQQQHRLLLCPINPTGLTARHSSRGIDRKPLHESAPKLIGGQRDAGVMGHTTHTTQETGSRIDERESEPAMLPSFLTDRAVKSFRKRHSRFIIIASRGIQARSLLTSTQRDAGNVVAREISIRVSLYQTVNVMNYGYIGQPAFCRARVFSHFYAKARRRFPNFSLDVTFTRYFYTWA